MPCMPSRPASADGYRSPPIETGGDTVRLTQEFLAEMLGVRRTSVTEIAIKMQDASAISYSRGIIKILDRPALETMSCECYQALLDQSASLNRLHYKG
jgi:hypothetical protein